MLEWQKSILSYLNPIYFEEKKIKKQFNKWYESSKIIQIRTVTLLTGILYLLYAQVDKLVAPTSILPVMTLLHLYILPTALFFITLLTFWNKFYKTVNYLFLVAPIGAALGNMFLIISLKESTIYFSEIYLIIIWIFIVSGLRLSYAVLSATTTLVLVILIGYYLFPMTKELFLMHFLWMLSAFSFGLLSAFILEKSNKIIFLNDQQLEKLATTDRLTGLYNRFKIEFFVDEEMNRAERYKRVFSVILVDIDNFKSVNDNYGHLVGDTVLRDFSNILKDKVRKSDIVGRWGGEEFLIILPEANVGEAKKVAEYLREQIENFEFANIKNRTSSFGVTQYREEDCIETIINRADTALYRAKENGRNQVQVL
ncbi:GGDEF domain-containing protein [Sulfurimonas sp.]|uniref:GGDEF domain-containing protein n=1 Tax=Sulfurimonas sp. TaxID=2022749 RepID=UPI0025D3E790|nr:GGDEF domain-containing protein [Sulfurimonas sp.]MDD5157518.1 GGDEF domain-containing protein [Sulfurimonas sp.]